MPDITYLLKRWGKQMLGVVLLSVLVVGVITFLKPKQFLSVATSVPASSFAADKSRVFSENIQALYSTLGTADDLDMIVGTANLDTVYLAVTDLFNLYDHYKMSEKGNAARTKAASQLKKNTKVMKSEYGELKVKVWDTDKDLAPQLANAIMDKLQSIHQDLQSAGNMATLKGLKLAKERMNPQADSAFTPENAEIHKKKNQQYDKMIDEYQLMVDTKPPSLIIVEKAKTSQWHDRPKRVQIMIATAILSLLFALFAALIMERRKTSPQ
jgi:uncharacterized protein involved in exopolysaccharide biosynthesis